MNLVRSIMGRRQFLAAAGMASTSALALGRLGTGIDPVFHAKAANASDSSAGIKGEGNRYIHLLSPLKIGNAILKNRMMHTQSLPHFFQGPETFPSEQVIDFYGGVAGNGAAIVTVWSPDIAFPGDGDLRDRKGLPPGDMGHMPMWDASDPSVQTYLSQLADAVHFYGSTASMGIRVTAPKGYNISSAAVPGDLSGMGGDSGKEIPVELIQKMIEDTVARALFYQSIGFDMVSFHMSYRNNTMAHVLSPVLNRRTDRYGGSIENRGRLALELFQAIKKACGQDFLILAHISGEEGEGGYTVQDAVQFARLWEETLDILQLRAPDGDAAHPTGLNSKKRYPLTLSYSQAIKQGGSKIITAPVGGYQDLALNEEFIASGKADMIAMARAWIADPEYGKKAKEGRGEDVVPCVLCNDCHGVGGTTGPWVNWCTVNPKMGIAHRVGRMIEAPARPKSVAVIGGGPAGMRAALIAAERGHRVTIYEKNDFLGGQLKHADYASFQWPLKNYKDYLINQLAKHGVEVIMNTRATPDMIRSKGYDAVVAAVGAEPFIPDIPGAEGSYVRAPIFVFGNEKALGKEIVVIGGDQIGTETGIYLAENGHNVTVLTNEKTLATDANQIHFIGSLRDAWQALSNFSFIPEVTVQGISAQQVTYTDADKNEKTVKADNVVIYAGRKPRQDEALGFYGIADEFFIIGDCLKVGNVARCNRSAYSAASQI